METELFGNIESRVFLGRIHLDGFKRLVSRTLFQQYSKFVEKKLNSNGPHSKTASASYNLL